MRAALFHAQPAPFCGIARRNVRANHPVYADHWMARHDADMEIIFACFFLSIYRYLGWFVLTNINLGWFVL